MPFQRKKVIHGSLAGLTVLLCSGCEQLALLAPFFADTRGTSGYLLASLDIVIAEYAPGDAFVNGGWYPDSDVRGLAFEKDQNGGNLLYVGTDQGLAIYRNIPREADLVSIIPVPDCEELSDVEVLTDGMIVASCMDNNSLFKINTNTGSIDDAFSCCGAINDDPRLRNPVAITPDGDILTGTSGIYRFDPHTGEYLEQVVELVQGASFYIDYAFGYDGNLYVSAAPNLGVLKFDGQTYEFLELFIPIDDDMLDYASAIAFGPNGNIAVAGSLDLVFRIVEFNGIDGSFIKVITASQEPVEDLDDIDDNYLAYRP